MSNEVVGYVIGAGGLFFGVYSYFTSGWLADKTKIIQQGMKIEELERRLNKLDEKVEEHEEWYNRGRNN